MNSTLSASNDPIFLLHHSFVDRILEKWLRKYNKNASVLSSYDAPIGDNRGDAIVPLFPVCTHEDFFMVSFDLGYDFEDVEEEGTCSVAVLSFSWLVYHDQSINKHALKLTIYSGISI